jgi:mannose-binding lectin 1
MPSKRILGGFTAFLCLLVQGAFASDEIQQEISFGQHGHHVWTEDQRHVQGWTINGSPGHHPELYSDRIRMTPPWPGNIRGSVWAQQPEHDDTFSATLEFRVAGTEHGSGNLQLWYVKEGPHTVGESSIYTVGKFDGLAIVVDQVAGHGGSIRGFLNDGSTSYKDHHHVDSLPFGHCNYPYRNTGHYVSLELKQTKKDVEVLVDGHRCFHTKKVLDLSRQLINSADKHHRSDFIQATTLVSPPPQQNNQTQSK